MLRPLIVAVAVALLAMAPVPAPPPALAVKTHSAALTQVVFHQPTIFSAGGNGAVSPAGCDITTIETPHVSTYSRVMNQVEEVKGNVRATCRHPVEELTLSVSIFDADTHEQLVKGAPTKNQNQASLRSNSTVVPCVNSNPTRYQVAALGTSYEQGHEYTQIKFSAVGKANCGHA